MRAARSGAKTVALRGRACALVFVFALVPVCSAHATGGARAATETPMIPASAPVGAYTAAASTRGGPPRDPLRDAIVEDARAAARRAGRPAPIADARLDWAMTDLARHLRGDQLPALEAVAFLLSHYGLVEPSPHFFFARASAGTDAEIRARARDEFAVALRAGAVGRIGVGIDRSGPEVHVVAGFQETPIALGGGDRPPSAPGRDGAGGGAHRRRLPRSRAGDHLTRRARPSSSGGPWA